jgi:hypothetical protein
MRAKAALKAAQITGQRQPVDRPHYPRQRGPAGDRRPGRVIPSGSWAPILELCAAPGDAPSRGRAASSRAPGAAHKPGRNHYDLDPAPAGFFFGRFEGRLLQICYRT